MPDYALISPTRQITEGMDNLQLRFQRWLDVHFPGTHFSSVQMTNVGPCWSFRSTDHWGISFSVAFPVDPKKAAMCGISTYHCGHIKYQITTRVCMDDNNGVGFPSLNLLEALSKIGFPAARSTYHLDEFRFYRDEGPGALCPSCGRHLKEVWIANPDDLGPMANVFTSMRLLVCEQQTCHIRRFVVRPIDFIQKGLNGCLIPGNSEE